MVEHFGLVTKGDNMVVVDLAQGRAETLAQTDLQLSSCEHGGYCESSFDSFIANQQTECLAVSLA